MFRVRHSADRGHMQHGWLDSFHTFSFADYYDPDQMGFRSLRVMNEDVIEPGQGFGMHGHQDMEIITCVLSGTLAHQDSLGHGAELRPGELQHMSAGTGIRHSEFNPSDAEKVHLYQIWIRPERAGLTPRYGQRKFEPADREDTWQVVASPDGREESLPIQTDASIYLVDLNEESEATYEFAPERHGWLQVLRGSVRCGEVILSAGDAVAISDESLLRVSAEEKAELMLFDLP